MKCLYCGCEDSKVIDSRSADEGRTIRRRRECVQCGKRFTTYETIEDTPVLVVKASGLRQAYDPQKIKNGIIKSCEKRPVSLNTIDDMVTAITKKIYNSKRLTRSHTCAMQAFIARSRTYRALWKNFRS